MNACTARARSAFVPHDLKAPIRGTPEGPLADLTAAVKDMYDITGERTGGGSPEWLAQARPAPAHAAAVRKILDAGATIVGKTVCDEFFFSVSGINAHYGTPLNPRAPGRIPGGSSSGSASATAAGACDFALGSDTGGSVRMPASFCGLYGIRPTHGRVDLSGAMPMAPSFDVAGWFANGPGVFHKLGAVLLDGERMPAAITNLILLDDAFAECDAAVVDLANAALAAMAPELPAPRHERLAPEGLDAWREAFRVLQAGEVWQTYGDFVTRTKPNLGPGIRERMQFAASVTEREIAPRQTVREKARARLGTLALPGTVLSMPTSPAIAPLIDQPQAEHDRFRIRVMRLTCTASLTGVPQVTIPVGTVKACPVGLSFLGWRGGDEVLLDLALRLSRYCGLAR
jgi:amidase